MPNNRPVTCDHTLGRGRIAAAGVLSMHSRHFGTNWSRLFASLTLSP